MSKSKFWPHAPQGDYGKELGHALRGFRIASSSFFYRPVRRPDSGLLWTVSNFNNCPYADSCSDPYADSGASTNQYRIANQDASAVTNCGTVCYSHGDYYYYSRAYSPRDCHGHASANVDAGAYINSDFHTFTNCDPDSHDGSSTHTYATAQRGSL